MNFNKTSFLALFFQYPLIPKLVENSFDVDTNKFLWLYNSDYGVNVPPISYSNEEIQYIYVAIGANNIV